MICYSVPYSLLFQAEESAGLAWRALILQDLVLCSCFSSLHSLADIIALSSVYVRLILAHYGISLNSPSFDRAPSILMMFRGDALISTDVIAGSLNCSLCEAGSYSSTLGVYLKFACV